MTFIFTLDSAINLLKLLVIEYFMVKVKAVYKSHVKAMSQWTQFLAV